MFSCNFLIIISLFSNELVHCSKVALWIFTFSNFSFDCMSILTLKLDRIEKNGKLKIVFSKGHILLFIIVKFY